MNKKTLFCAAVRAGRAAWRPVLGVALALAALGSAHAQGQEILRLVVPFAAGSYTDNVARIVAPEMAKRLGKNIIIENRAGANGIIGADYVARAKPDGLTLLVGGASVNTINPSVYKTLPYDPVNDLLPVARIGLLPLPAGGQPCRAGFDGAGADCLRARASGQAVVRHPQCLDAGGHGDLQARRGRRYPQRAV
jgi:hypothetical protein